MTEPFRAGPTAFITDFTTVRPGLREGEKPQTSAFRTRTDSVQSPDEPFRSRSGPLVDGVPPFQGLKDHRVVVGIHTFRPDGSCSWIVRLAMLHTITETVKSTRNPLRKSYPPILPIVFAAAAFPFLVQTGKTFHDLRKVLKSDQNDPIQIILRLAGSPWKAIPKATGRFRNCENRNNRHRLSKESRTCKALIVRLLHFVCRLRDPYTA